MSLGEFLDYPCGRKETTIFSTIPILLAHTHLLFIAIHFRSDLYLPHLPQSFISYRWWCQAFFSLFKFVFDFYKAWVYAATVKWLTEGGSLQEGDASFSILSRFFSCCHICHLLILSLKTSLGASFLFLVLYLVSSFWSNHLRCETEYLRFRLFSSHFSMDRLSLHQLIPGSKSLFQD